jgi:protein gp37
MAAKTNISWCEHTFNPWVGCMKVSPACDHCYAELWAKRSGHPELWQGQRRRTTPANWAQPLKWDAAARAAGKRVRVFCASLADVFDNAVPMQWRVDLFELIGKTTNIDWLLLTKRIGNAHRMLDEVMDVMSHGLQRWDEPMPWPNVWLGATVCNQAEADRDIPKLLATPVRVRFLSCEPLLGPINIGQYLWECCGSPTPGGCFDDPPECCRHPNAIDKLHWAIAGGESGGKARPSHPDWFRSLRDQCAAAGVAFHFKQHGEWHPEMCANFNAEHIWPDRVRSYRVGKKAAVRALDGVVHDAFPEVQS